MWQYILKVTRCGVIEKNNANYFISERQKKTSALGPMFLYYLEKIAIKIKKFFALKDIL